MNNHIQTHLFTKHLPWYLYPHVACWTCKVNAGTLQKLKTEHSDCDTTFTNNRMKDWTGRAVGFLFHLAKQFGCQTPHELLQLVVDRKLYVELQQPKVIDSSVVYLNQVDSYLSLTPVKEHPLKPPTMPSDLLSVGLLMILVKQLPETKQLPLVLYNLKTRPNGEVIRDQAMPALGRQVEGIPKQVLDSHFHYTCLLDCHNKDLGRIYRSMLEKLVAPGVLCEDVRGSVSNMVFPKCRAALPTLLQDNRMKLRFTVGYHPKDSTPVDSAWLKSVAGNPLVVGIGECGLDVSDYQNSSPLSSSRAVETQKASLRAQAKVAKETNLVLVLHLRGKDQDLTSFSDVHRMAQHELQEILPSHHPIYLHSFVGTKDDIRQWTKMFPGIVFGVSAVVDKHPHLRQTYKEAGVLSQMLPETDAPYLLPKDVRQKLSGNRNSPHLLPSNINMVARWYNLPTLALTSYFVASANLFWQTVKEEEIAPSSTGPTSPITGQNTTPPSSGPTSPIIGLEGAGIVQDVQDAQDESTEEASLPKENVEQQVQEGTAMDTSV